MKKRIMLTAVVSACVFALCACQSGNQEQFPLVTQQPMQSVATSQPTLDNSLTGGDSYTDYDPAAEENITDPNAPTEGDALPTAAEITTAPTVRSEYAGATPVVIDPIDKPTPTPVPPLTFTFQAYDATKLHLSFEGPVGWTVDDTQNDVFILTNPDASVDYAANVTIRAASVTSQYGVNDMTKEVKQLLATIKEGFKSFSPSNTAERSLLGKDGVYANYKGTLDSGVRVAGRIHVACVDKVLYTVYVTYPQDYTATYVENVYGRIRKTIKITQ